MPMKKIRPEFCSIDDCGKKRRGKSGLCAMHDARVKAHGDPHFTLRPRNDENPSYAAMHRRIRNERGHAKEYSCFISIDHPAMDWAFIKETAAEEDLITQSVKRTYQKDTIEITYSKNTLDYKPLCKHHHIKMDSHGWSLWDMVEDYYAPNWP